MPQCPEWIWAFISAFIGILAIFVALGTFAIDGERTPKRVYFAATMSAVAFMALIATIGALWLPCRDFQVAEAIPTILPASTDVPAMTSSPSETPPPNLQITEVITESLSATPTPIDVTPPTESATFVPTTTSIPTVPPTAPATSVPQPTATATTAPPTATSAPTITPSPTEQPPPTATLVPLYVTVPGNSEQGTVIEVEKPGYYVMHYMGGAYSPWPVDEGVPGGTWATNLQFYINRPVQWGPTSFTDYQLLGPINFDEWIGTTGYFATQSIAESAALGSYASLGYLQSGEQVRCIAVDEQGRYFDNRGQVELMLEYRE